MAVDTAEKRFSAMNMGFAGPLLTMPVPVNPETSAERFHRLGLYSGFGATPVTTNDFSVGGADVHWRAQFYTISSVHTVLKKTN